MEVCILYLSDNANYNFDIYVIDYAYLGCVFCCRIKENKKDTFYFNFNLFYKFPPKFFFFFSFFQLNNYNRYAYEIYNFTFYNELITYKVL